MLICQYAVNRAVFKMFQNIGEYYVCAYAFILTSIAIMKKKKNNKKSLPCNNDKSGCTMASAGK